MPYTKEMIREKINTDQTWLQRAIIAIYNKQTAEEKIDNSTKEYNGQGFNSSDARLGTYYAKYLLKGYNLSGHHIERARKMMKKYCGQLERIANK